MKKTKIRTMRDVSRTASYRAAAAVRFVRRRARELARNFLCRIDLSVSRCRRRLPTRHLGELAYGLSALLIVGGVVLATIGRHGETDNAVQGLGQPELYVAYATQSGPPELPPEPPRNVLTFTQYTVEAGDTISDIAARFNLNQDSIITTNDIERARSLQIGTELRIPNMDGIMHPIGAADSLEEISARYEVPLEQILEVNNIETIEQALEGESKLFIPTARMPAIELRRVWGELFSYPVRGWISSGYGYRIDPFTGRRSFHNGIDIARAIGTPVGAAMEGTVHETGYTETAGNYVLINHAGGYTTFYAHLHVITVRQGQRVREGQIIGQVGNTGRSTGSHLHFTIFRYGRSVNPRLLLH